MFEGSCGGIGASVLKEKETEKANVISNDVEIKCGKTLCSSSARNLVIL